MRYMLFCFIVWSSMQALAAFPVLVQSWNLEADVKALSALKLSIDNVNRSTGTISADVRTEAEYEQLLALGFRVEKLPDITREYYEYLLSNSGDDPMRAYYSIDEYHTFMQATATAYPNICCLVQFGTSIQNRPLYAMKISDNALLNESEPELKYIGSIHGDETVGYDMLIRLIQLLTSQYGTDPRITNIVNNTEIWITPLMNPDGYVLGQRYNAAGIDLNRNFPMPTGVDHPDDNPWAPENIALMDFSNAHNFALSINFHGGALVINYPWDYTPILAPDDALLQQLSLTYSMHNLPMYNSTEFPQGITNGAAWYIITGSMQDWNYAFTSCIELTAEISNIKWPAASTLDTYWAQNQESLLSYIEFTQRGIKGLVTDSASNPIPAEISITGNSKVIRNDPIVGDYHRILLPGTYTVNVSSPGYINQAVEVTVPAAGHITQHFTLQTAMLTTCSGQIRSLSGLPVPGANVSIQAQGLQTVTNANGEFTIPDIYEGIYEISVFAPGYGLYQNTFNLRVNSGRQVIVLAPPLFSDDFESDLSQWTVTTPWAIVQQNGNGVLTDSPTGDYNNNVNRAIRLSSPVNLQDVTMPRLSFKARWDLETSYDYVFVEGSTNLTNWREIHRFTGLQEQWQAFTFALDEWSTGNFYLRFRIRSDYNQSADGIYLDDVLISGYRSQDTVYGDVDANAIVNLSDASAILEYGLGLDPLPQLDPAPWEAPRLTAADVNNSGNISAWDAYLVVKYLTEPSFQFQTQGAPVFQIPAADVAISLQNSLVIGTSQPIQLHALQIILDQGIGIGDIQSSGNEPGPYTICAVNPTDGAFGMVSPSPFPTQITLSLVPIPESLGCLVENNGIVGHYQLQASGTTGDNAAPAPAFALHQNYPNPFNPNTTIRFSLPAAGLATLEIYNTKGQKIKTLVATDLSSGAHNLTWDGLDAKGNDLPAGIYLYRLTQGRFTQHKKMVLSK